MPVTEKPLNPNGLLWGKGFLAYVKSLLPGVGYAPVIQDPANGGSLIIDSWLPRSPGLQHLFSRRRIAWEGFYGPAIEEMCMTSTHIPLASALSVVPSLCKGNWEI